MLLKKSVPQPDNSCTRLPSLEHLYTEKMSSSTEDSDSELLEPLFEELRNVQSVMYVTRENIDALNARFANLQDPPVMYVTEYQELTSKLHELELKERDLTEQLQVQADELAAAQPPPLPPSKLLLAGAPDGHDEVSISGVVV